MDGIGSEMDVKLHVIYTVIIASYGVLYRIYIEYSDQFADITG